MGRTVRFAEPDAVQQDDDPPAENSVPCLARCCHRSSTQPVAGPLVRTVHEVGEMHYSMHLVPMANLLGSESAVCHEEMLKEDRLVTWNAELPGSIIFVSHEWLGFCHADPDGLQFNALKRILHRLLHREVTKVESNWVQTVLLKQNSVVSANHWASQLLSTYVWYDFMCIPQVCVRGSSDDEAHLASGGTDSMIRATRMENANALAKAVDSIPAYVENSDLILILTPLATHQDRGDLCDYASWRSRGWCRMELWAALLARGGSTVMICKGAEATPEFIAPYDALSLPAMEGNFTCCRLGHQINGSEVSCDKGKVLRVLESMLELKVRHLLSEGKVWTMRHFVCLRKRICQGGDSQLFRRTTSQLNMMSFDDFVFKLSWQKEDESAGAATGRSLLLYASRAGESEALRAILNRSCSGINDEVRDPELVLGELPVTPLSAAMVYADFEVVEQLLISGADPMRRTVSSAASGMDAFMLCLSFGPPENACAWLRRFPEWDVDRREPVARMPCLVMSTVNPKSHEMLCLLLEARARPDAANDMGGTGLHNICWSSDNSNPEAVIQLLDSGIDVNAQMIPTAKKWRAVQAAARAAVRLGVRSAVVDQFAFWGGGTALHGAVARGKVIEIEMLLEAKADPKITNFQGRTPLQLAEVVFNGTVPSAIKCLLAGRETDALMMCAIQTGKKTKASRRSYSSKASLFTHIGSQSWSMLEFGRNSVAVEEGANWYNINSVLANDANTGFSSPPQAFDFKLPHLRPDSWQT